MMLCEMPTSVGGPPNKPKKGGPKHLVDQHRSLKNALKSGTLPGMSGAERDASGLPEGIKKMPDGTYKCIICDHPVLLNYFSSHCSSDRHKTLLLLEKIKNSRAEAKHAPRLRIESSAIFDPKKGEHVTSVKFREEEEVASTMTFTVTNICANTVFKFKDWIGPYISDEVSFQTPEEQDITLRPNEQLKLTMLLTPKKESVHAFKIFFRFEDLNRRAPLVVDCSVKISFISDTTADLSSTGGYYNYRKKRTPVRRFYRRGAAVPGVPLPGLGDRDGLEKDRSLPWYDMSKAVHQFINDGLVINNDFKPDEVAQLIIYKAALDEDDLTFHNYQKRFTVLLYMEEHQTNVDMEMYFMEKVRLQKHGRSNLLSLEIPGLAENRPSVLRGDQMFVRQYLGPDNYGPKEYQGYVHDVQQTRVFLGFSTQLVNKFYPGMEFCVRFVNNRLPMRLQHRALSLIEPDESDLENVLFPTEDTARTHGGLIPTDTKFQFYSRNPEPNPEQARAIHHIVQGSSRPAPYIVFGPPGTGKTFTIVESIKQVLKHIPGALVLACAPSNSAADLITEKLLSHMQEREVYRMNAFSRPLITIPDKIKNVCNLTNDGDVCFPTKSDLAKKGIRVYVTTLITAGRFVSAEFAHDHFTHVFIDEASQATEPESLVAIAGLMYVNSSMDRGKQVVLAGDPQQLGPILRSPYAKKLKLDVSLMERLMGRSLYSRSDKPDADGLHYDPMMLTKLVRNYRSHPDILAVPNRLFYNEELVASGLREMTHRMCGWEKLPNKDVPMIFHSVIGEDMQEANSPSFFNPHEVSLVMKYVGWLVNEKSPMGPKIKQEHIGIITPYRKQVQKIHGELKKKGLLNLKVGSVEEFQGQERLIIILSTVRSNPRFLTTDNKFGIGFLQNDKRFNVAVTRAKALLIVIGNPNILRHNASWSSFVQYCVDKNCMVDRHLDRCDEDATFQKLREQLEALDMNGDVADIDADSGDISAFNNELVNRRDI